MKYGSVYTPPALASFAAKLLQHVAASDGNNTLQQVLDPACGGLSLLSAASDALSREMLTGIDVDHEAVLESAAAISESGLHVKLIESDFILPSKSSLTTAYWKNKLGTVDAILANPPWSSDRIYSREDLIQHGIKIVDGQYDAYSLFIEVGIGLLSDGGYGAYILPDSLFSSTAIELRRFLLEETSIRIIARLGERLFPGVHRSTAIVVFQKAIPQHDSQTECFRLNTEDRKKYLYEGADLFDLFLQNRHLLNQSHFLRNSGLEFDIDTDERDEKVLASIERRKTKWTSNLKFFRGIELSKTGKVYLCPYCGSASSISSKERQSTLKKCPHCSMEFYVEEGNIKQLISDEHHEGWKKLLVGESVVRYSIRSNKYVAPPIKGINFKTMSIYMGPKLLVRKTGLGIKSVVSTESELTTQTVYFFKSLNLEEDGVDSLYFYAALLNSRTIYYYYLKKNGENEWKSHPYLTKTILENLPLISFDKDNPLHAEVASYSLRLCKQYDKTLDLELEQLIQNLYELSNVERDVVRNTMNELPDLSAIREMKF